MFLGSPTLKFNWLLGLWVFAAVLIVRAPLVNAQERTEIVHPLIKEALQTQTRPVDDSAKSVQTVEVFEYAGELESPLDNSEDRLGWFSNTRVGYDGGFIIANSRQQELNSRDLPFCLQINGWGQLRHTIEFTDESGREDVNQFALKRGRLIFQGSAYTPDFFYYIQLDGRSSSGDDVRLLDFYLSYDVGRHRWGLEKGVFGFRTGKYKMPFSLARYLSGRELEFADRSVASTFFDVNRSFAWGLYGSAGRQSLPVNWEVAIFNGLVTGGAETGSSGTLDNNFAYSARVFSYPVGDWGVGELADFEGHCRPAVRTGMGFANSTIQKFGSTEFNAIRVVNTGRRLSELLPTDVNEFTVNLVSVDASIKYRGWSATLEYYFRIISDFEGASIPDLYDHGFWLQAGKFIVPDHFQVLARWSRVVGNSGTLGQNDLSSNELAGGFSYYFREQHAKLVFDCSYLDSAPIDSSSLGILPGDTGWLCRTQIQFSF